MGRSPVQVSYRRHEWLGSFQIITDYSGNCSNAFTGGMQPLRGYMTPVCAPCSKQSAALDISNLTHLCQARCSSLFKMNYSDLTVLHLASHQLICKRLMTLACSSGELSILQRLSPSNPRTIHVALLDFFTNCPAFSLYA